MSTSTEAQKHPNRSTSIVEPKACPQATSSEGLVKYFSPSLLPVTLPVYTIAEQDFGKILLIDLTGTSGACTLTLPSLAIGNKKSLAIRMWKQASTAQNLVIAGPTSSLYVSQISTDSTTAISFNTTNNIPLFAQTSVTITGAAAQLIEAAIDCDGLRYYVKIHVCQT